jgi:hypothetical protein
MVENSRNRLLTDKVVATLYLLILSMQYVLVDGWGTSVVKTLFSALSVVFLISRSRYITKALMLAFLYCLVLSAVYFFQFSGQHMTIIHIVLYMLHFCLFYNLVYVNQVYNHDDFIKVIKAIIFIYTAFIIIQQFFVLIGVRYFPLVNLYGMRYYSFSRLPTIALEPSHAARILSVCLYALLKVSEYKFGRALTLKELYSTYKWPLIACIYTLLFIGSGTGMVGLFIVSLYFLKKQYTIIIATVLIVGFFVSPSVDYEPLNRVLTVIEASATLDTEIVRDADNSASARVAPLISMLTKLDLSDSKIWFGYGQQIFNINLTIDKYGFFTYLFLILFIIGCCISDIQGILFFVFLFSMDLSNFAYAYCILMILSAVKFFKIQRSYAV